MKHEHESLALLRRANPVRVDPAAVGSVRATAVLEQIIGVPRDSRDPRSSDRGAARIQRTAALPARLAFGAAGIAAAAAAVVLVALSGSGVAPAFARWTPSPTVASAERIADVTHRCGLGRPVLVEARGPYTAAVFVKRSGGSACVLGPSIGFGVVSLGGVRAPDNQFKPDQVGTAVTTGSDSRGHAYVLIAGRIGSAVRSIVIHRSNNVDVTASLRNGWYLAWWPARVRAIGATVTTTTGARNLALPPLATMAPAACSGPEGTACAAVGGGGDSNGPGSAGVPGPPLNSGPLAKPFNRTLLLNVYNATRVLVCFHPPSKPVAALQPNGPTGPCERATLLTRLPRSYPVQRNLLEEFPNSVWVVKLPPDTPSHGGLSFLVVAYGTQGNGQVRNEFTLN